MSSHSNSSSSAGPGRDSDTAVAASSVAAPAATVQCSGAAARRRAKAKKRKERKKAEQKAASTSATAAAHPSAPSGCAPLVAQRAAADSAAGSIGLISSLSSAAPTAEDSDQSEMVQDEPAAAAVYIRETLLRLAPLALACLLSSDRVALRMKAIFSKALEHIEATRGKAKDDKIGDGGPHSNPDASDSARQSADDAAAAVVAAPSASAADSPSTPTAAELQASCSKVAKLFAFVWRPAANRSPAQSPFLLAVMRMAADISRVLYAHQVAQWLKGVAATVKLGSELIDHMAHLLVKNGFKAELQDSRPDDRRRAEIDNLAALFPPSAICETIHRALFNTEFLQRRTHLTSLDKVMLVAMVLDAVTQAGEKEALYALRKASPGPLLFHLLRLDDFEDVRASLRKEGAVSCAQDIMGRLSNADEFGEPEPFESPDSDVPLFTLPVRNSDAVFLIKIEWISLELYRHAGSSLLRHAQLYEQLQHCLPLIRPGVPSPLEVSVTVVHDGQSRINSCVLPFSHEGSLSGALSFIGLNRGCCASQFLPPDEPFVASKDIHPRRAAALNLVAAIEGRLVASRLVIDIVQLLFHLGYLLLDVKPANFLLRVESESTSSTSGALAPSPSAAAAGVDSKINSASVSAGVAGQVDSTAAVSAALRLGVVAIDYGDHFDLAANRMTSNVDHYAQQCDPTSASFKQPGERVMQFVRGCTERFTDPLAFRMQRLLAKFRDELQLLETLEIGLQSEDGAHADRADSEGDRDPCANSGDKFDSLSNANSAGHSFADSDDYRFGGGSVADDDPTADADSDADLHGDSCAGVEFQVDPHWHADLANVSIASDDIVSDDGVDDDDGSITPEWIRLHRAKILSRVTSSLESMRSFGQVIAVTSALNTVAATLCPHCFDENEKAEDSEEDDSAVKKWADCPLLRHLAHLQRPRNLTSSEISDARYLESHTWPNLSAAFEKIPGAAAVSVHTDTAD